MLNLLVHIHVASSDKERALEILRVTVERFGTELRCAGVQNLAFMYVLEASRSKSDLHCYTTSTEGHPTIVIADQPTRQCRDSTRTDAFGLQAT